MDKPPLTPLDYRRDAPTPAGAVRQWITLLVVWTLGLISWTFWVSLCLLAFFRLFS